jgi:hypothetical protein
MTHITDYGGAIDDYYPARIERIADMNPQAKFLAALRSTHPDMVKLFTEGRCYSLFEMMRILWPQANPLHSKAEGHVYTEIDGDVYDIRGKHLKLPADIGPLDYRAADAPHRWALRDKRRFVEVTEEKKNDPHHRTG